MQKIKFVEDSVYVAIDALGNYQRVEFKKDKWYDFRSIYPGLYPDQTALLTKEGYVINSVGVQNITFRIKKVFGAQEFYKDIALAFNAYNNCLKSGNKEWENKHADRIEELVKEYLPHGSGFDSGTEFNWEESSENKLVFSTAFHHMNEGGCYDGWTEHKVIVRPCLSFDFNIKVTGRNRNDIKEYIASAFNDFEYSPEALLYGN